MKKKLAILSWVSAVAFAIAGILMPPVGEIDESVLMLIAQLLLFCATLMGVDSYFDKMRELLKK